MQKNIWLKVLAIDMLLLCFSLNVSLVGQMVDSIQQVYLLNLTQAGMLLSAQSIGGLTLAVICIFFIDALNKQKILVLCGIALCGALMLVGAGLPLFLLFVIFVLLGFSGGAINTLTNSVMVETVPGRPERYLNFMHMLFSLGAVSTPVLSQTIYNASGLTGVFLLFGGFALCWAVYAAFAFSSQVRLPVVKEHISLKKRFRETIDVFKKPGMGCVFIIAILISCWQMSGAYYISAFFSGIRGRGMDGATALTVFFFGMMLSRLLYTRIADRFPKGRVLMLTNLLAALAWICMFLVPDITAKMILAGVAVLCCGNNFPVLFAASCAIAPKNTAAATGLVTFGYYIAILTFIPLVGSLGDTAGARQWAAPLCPSAAASLFRPDMWLHKRMRALEAAGR